MKNVLIISPHPDDETLGCGGTLLKHKVIGDVLHWIIITNMKASHQFSIERIQKRNAEIIYVPYRGDVHTDHAVVFDAVISCTKWFRYPYVKQVLAYETLSETDFGLNPDSQGFRPNLFVNIEGFLEEKINIMKIYESEMGMFPFPRSEQAIRALAYVRGAASGYQAAEAFMILKARWD